MNRSAKMVTYPSKRSHRESRGPRRRSASGVPYAHRRGGPGRFDRLCRPGRGDGRGGPVTGASLARPAPVTGEDTAQITQEEFRSALARHAAGVVVVTARPD